MSPRCTSPREIAIPATETAAFGVSMAGQIGADNSRNSMTHVQQRLTRALALAGVTALLGGCTSLGPMPDLIPGKVLSKDERQSKVDGMIQRAQTHESDATKQIESGK
jgi:hypothetical protein